MDLKKETLSHPLDEEFPSIFHFGFVVVHTYRDPATQKEKKELILPPYGAPFWEYDQAKKVADALVEDSTDARKAEVVEIKPRCQMTSWPDC